MGHVSTPPLDGLVEFCARELGIPIFIETGTNQGQSAAWAAERFREVVTIELSRDLLMLAIQLTLRPNIRFRHGRSPEVLRQFVTLPEPKVFWLDAHWSGAGTSTAGIDEQCPVLQELAVVCQSETDDVILVDDFHMFAVPPPSPFRAEQWPSIEQLIAAIAPLRERQIFVYGNAFVVARGRTAAPIHEYFRTLTPAPG